MNAISGIQISRNHWWLLALRGLFAVLFGLVALVFPGMTLLALVLLFGAYALVNGVMAGIVSFQERNVFSQWWVLLIEGLLGIIAGLLTLFWPAITALVLLYLIASWAIITGIFQLIGAFTHGLPAVMEWTLGLTGVLSIILGIVLAIRPAAGLLGLVWVIGIYALIFGVLLIIRAFQYRTAPSVAV